MSPVERHLEGPQQPAVAKAPPDISRAGNFFTFRDPKCWADRRGADLRKCGWGLTLRRSHSGQGRFLLGPLYSPSQDWAGFRAITMSIAFRWGTPLALETNSPSPESKISQSQ